MENLTDYAGFDGMFGELGAMLMTSLILDYDYREAWQYTLPEDYPRDCNPKLVF